MTSTTSTVPLCGYCGRPIVGAMTFGGGVAFHPECTRGPVSDARAADIIARLTAELVEALERAETAYARGFHDAQEKAKIEGRWTVVNNPELAEARAEKESAYAVGFAAGIEAAANLMQTLHRSPTHGLYATAHSQRYGALTDVAPAAIRALTAPDATKAAARVLLANGIEGFAMQIAVEMEVHAALSTTTMAKADVIVSALRALAEGGERVEDR